MLFHLNLEEIENRWVAHLAGWPGGFASGETRDEAIAAAEAAMPEYFAWLRRHGEQPPEVSCEFLVDEVHRAWISEDEYEVNAFFAADRAPLTAEEVEVFGQRLNASRADLLDAYLGLQDEMLKVPLPGERWPINGVLNHVASAENFYLGRFNLDHAAAWEMTDVLGKLMLVRAQFNEALRLFVDRADTVTIQGEAWSPRKIIRRALWHELDHAAHIRQLRTRLVSR
ncbi:MAG: DinB family protein [Anaerolineales bacterium]